MSSAMTDPLEVVERVADMYDEARQLIVGEHHEMAVVRAVSAFELFLKRAFIEPYLRQGMLAEHPRFGDLVIHALLEDSQRWKEHLGPLFRSCWQIDVGGMPLWREMGRAWRSRNEIVHNGAATSNAEAARIVSTCDNLTRALLLARSSAKAR
jgi:hypothetical protein